MDRDYSEFYSWAKKKLGLDLKSYKQRQLQRRIGTVMSKSGAENLREYKEKLESDLELRKIFLDYITINVTEFYRNRSIFEEFEDAFMREVVPFNNTYKVWSAACSIGAEAYTLAMIFDKNKILNKTKIIATDIDETVLQKALDGVYDNRYLKEINDKERDTYFNKTGGKYRIKDNLKEKVQFRKHDLILSDYEDKFNAIICRNVTIYFKDEAKNDIYKKMSDSLLPKGLLFTGATESIYNPGDYGLKKIQTFIYQKMG